MSLLNVLKTLLTERSVWKWAKHHLMGTFVVKKNFYILGNNESKDEAKFSLEGNFYCSPQILQI